jgi:transposase, IS5 family
MSKFIPFGNPGLFDSFIQDLDVRAFETPLARIGKLIDWQMFESTLHKAVLRSPKGPGGRPRFQPLLMFKILVLQRLHNLADDDASFQITDRSSFRAFLGLTPADPVPDGQTIRDFREDLIAHDSFETLFQTFLSHLQNQHGLALAKQGVIVDATFVDVPKQRNSREDNAQIKASQVPASLAEDPKRLAQKDLDARWTKKNGETRYGYKNHIKADVTDKLILASTVTNAAVHDSQVLEQLICPSDKSVFADSAYRSAETEARLAAQGIESHIHEKGQINAPLSSQQQELNQAKSGLRARVEHIFGHMTMSMHALYQRYIGMERNRACIQLTNLVYNLVRFEQIVRLKLA